MSAKKTSSRGPRRHPVAHLGHNLFQGDREENWLALGSTVLSTDPAAARNMEIQNPKPRTSSSANWPPGTSTSEGPCVTLHSLDAPALQTRDTAQAFTSMMVQRRRSTDRILTSNMSCTEGGGGCNLGGRGRYLGVCVLHTRGTWGGRTERGSLIQPHVLGRRAALLAALTPVRTSAAQVHGSVLLKAEYLQFRTTWPKQRLAGPQQLDRAGAAHRGCPMPEPPAPHKRGHRAAGQGIKDGIGTQTDHVADRTHSHCALARNNTEGEHACTPQRVQPQRRTPGHH